MKARARSRDDQRQLTPPTSVHTLAVPSVRSRVLGGQGSLQKRPPKAGTGGCGPFLSTPAGKEVKAVRSRAAAETPGGARLMLARHGEAHNESTRDTLDSS